MQNDVCKPCQLSEALARSLLLTDNSWGDANKDMVIISSKTCSLILGLFDFNSFITSFISVAGRRAHDPIYYSVIIRNDPVNRLFTQ